MKSEGSGLEVTWPAYDVGDPTRRFSQDQDFTIVLSYNDDGPQEHVEETKSFEDYKRWGSKDTYRADLYNVGGLKEIHRE